MTGLPYRLHRIRSVTKCCDLCVRPTHRERLTTHGQALHARHSNTWTHLGTQLLSRVHAKRHTAPVRHFPPPHRSRGDTADYYRTVSSHDMEKFLDSHTHALEVNVPCLGRLVTLRVQVFDNHPEDVEQRRLTVVCLPGSGTKETDAGFIPYLCAKGVRVIIPQRVGRDKIILKARQRPAVDYSLHGKHVRLEAVLAAKDIQRVDLLVSGNTSFWTLLKAGAAWDNIHSLACGRPEESRPTSYLHPHIRYRRALSRVAHTLVRWCIRPLLEFLYFTIKDSKKVSSYAQQTVLESYVKTLSYSWENTLRDAATIRDKRLPLLLFLSENDRLARLDTDTLASKCLGIPRKNLLRVSKVDAEAGNGEPFSVPETSWFARTIIFEKGIDQGSRSQVITELLEELLVRVRDVDFPDIQDETAGTADETAGTADETAGTADETAGTADETAGTADETAAETAGNSEIRDASGQTDDVPDQKTNEENTNEHKEEDTCQIQTEKGVITERNRVEMESGMNDTLETKVGESGVEVEKTLNDTGMVNNENENEDQKKRNIDETVTSDEKHLEKETEKKSSKKETIYDI